ncbi:MAG: L,D-transpeptidase family protein [Pseudomonadota bacterium]
MSGRTLGFITATALMSTALAGGSTALAHHHTSVGATERNASVEHTATPPQIDTDAIAARDARMMQALEAEAIALRDARMMEALEAEAITLRDARMLDALTTQSIAQMIQAGLENDGETTATERQAAEAFYAERDHRPVFVTAGQLTERGATLAELFRTADAYGLNPDDFRHEAFLSLDEPASDARAAAQADIAMTLWALRYARHAKTGRVNPREIASDITLERNFVDPATVMPAVLASDDLSEALLNYHPPHAEFHALRVELARLRDEADRVEFQPIAEGGTLRLGDVDARVPELRARLGLPEPTPDPITTASVDDPRLILASTQSDIEAPAAVLAPINPNRFDETLDEAVRAFQGNHNLTADGIVGPATFAALNASAGDLVPDIIANMERWRWMPRDLGEFHVIANVPEFRLWVRQEGEAIFTTRTVVGQNKHRTAIFSDEMEYMAVNPYWNVPASIARNELLPRVLEDPGYLLSGGYEVVHNGQVFSPLAVNWQLASEQGLPRIRQQPGRGNALGEIKFMFPNQHAIYFHDTPSRSLFGRDHRSFSHGCVRVQNPWEFAEALLTNEPDWDVARARSLQGPNERNIMLDTHIPVHITYFTARVDEDGRLIMAGDLYGHHARVVAALGLGKS